METQPSAEITYAVNRTSEYPYDKKLPKNQRSLLPTPPNYPR